MSLLLDTHVVLWWLTDDPTLSDDIKARLDHEPDVYVSAATIWEVAIKQAAGKLLEPSGLPERIRDSGFAPLPLSPPFCFPGFVKAGWTDVLWGGAVSWRV